MPIVRASLILLPIAVLLVGCGRVGGSGASAERFCGEIQLHSEQITRPNLQFEDDIEPLLDLYRDIGELAPLSIEPEWDQLISAYETASTVVPGNPESQQAALSAIYSTEKSAAAIDNWLEKTCAVNIGPVFTIVAQEP
jgi:hypothetical protein|tara:strand:+ start:1512 stop:1928 length:417 start_codon:yes stop_codon:yes gene_type:complete